MLQNKATTEKSDPLIRLKILVPTDPVNTLKEENLFITAKMGQN